MNVIRPIYAPLDWAERSVPGVHGVLEWYARLWL